MDDFDIEVVSTPPPRKPDGPWVLMLRRVAALLRAALMRPRALALGGAVAFVLAVGTPHVGWDYECRHPMRSGQPCRSASYCAYYGIQGRRVVFPEDGGSCQLVTFLRIDWRRIV